MKAILLLTTAALMLGALPLEASMLPGTKLKNFPANPKKHVVTLKRQADTETAKKMISAAETAKPATGVWWNVKDDKETRVMGLKTPYALTADALKYYAEQIEGYQKKDWKGRVNEPSSQLDYIATVTHHKTFALDGKNYKNVHVVTMKMVFQTSLTVEAFGGTDFSKQRTVVLDETGKVLAISGDKAEEFAMWMM